MSLAEPRGAAMGFLDANMAMVKCPSRRHGREATQEVLIGVSTSSYWNGLEEGTGESSRLKTRRQACGGDQQKVGGPNGSVKRRVAGRADKYEVGNRSWPGVAKCVPECTFDGDRRALSGWRRSR